MGFSSYDDLISELTAGKRNKRVWQNTFPNVTGVAGRWYSTWTWTGSGPGATYTAAGSLSSQAFFATTLGALFAGNNVSPDTKHLLSVSAMSPAATAVPGIAILVDRLLTYPGIVCTPSATQSTATPVTLPRYTTGAGVVAWFEAANVLGTAQGGLAGVQVVYTNSDGVATRTTLGTTSAIYSASQASSIANTATSSQFFRNPFLPYASTDTGIQSVQEVKFTGGTMTSGVMQLVLGYPLCSVPIPAVNVLSERDLVFQLANLARVYDGACLNWLIFAPGAIVANTSYTGELDVGWG